MGAAVGSSAARMINGGFVSCLNKLRKLSRGRNNDLSVLTWGFYFRKEHNRTGLGIQLFCCGFALNSSTLCHFENHGLDLCKSGKASNFARLNWIISRHQRKLLKVQQATEMRTKLSSASKNQLLTGSESTCHLWEENHQWTYSATPEQQRWDSFELPSHVFIMSNMAFPCLSEDLNLELKAELEATMPKATGSRVFRVLQTFTQLANCDKLGNIILLFKILFWEK